MALEIAGKGDSADDFPPINDLNSFLLEAKVLFQGKWNSKEIPRAQMSDFERCRVVGAGAFGRVILVRHKRTGRFCAMKTLEKASLVKYEQVEHAYYEMKTLMSVRFPFIVSMLYSMKDNSNLYFVLPFVEGGELFHHLQELGRFNEEEAKFYAVQVCLALEYLHYLDIIYRDLKPENILIDYRGYLKLSDLGFCKIVKGRTYTFCGTPEYIAPEIISTKPYGKAVDWWSYGILLYEMNAGYPPFSSRDSTILYEKIVVGKYKHALHFSEELQDLITQLLQTDCTKRFGNLLNGVEDIKRHQWFKNVNWLDILNYRVVAPYVPKYINAKDRAHFDAAHLDPAKQFPLRVAAKDRYAKTFAKF